MQLWQQRLQQLTVWWKTRLGQKLLQQEKQYLTEILQDKFGQHLILLATEEFADLITISRMHNSLRIDPFENNELSLPNNIDLIVIPHILAYCVTANEWLQSFWQVLVADGKVLITGFNFMSYLGISRILLKDNVRGLPSQLYSARQLKKLGLENDFKLLKQSYFAKNYNYEKVIKTIIHTQFGNLYSLLLSKQIVTVKTMEPNWQQTTKIGQQNLVNPFIGEKH